MMRYLIMVIIGSATLGCAWGRGIRLSEDVPEARSQLEPIITVGDSIESVEENLIEVGFRVTSRTEWEDGKHIRADLDKPHFGVVKKWYVVLVHDEETLQDWSNHFGMVGP